MGLKFLSRLFSGRTQTPESQATARRCLVEPLENRQLMTLTVTSILADNRGSVQIVLGGDADPATVHRTSVQVYGTGPDGIIYNSDDNFIPSAIRYYPSIRRISINFDIVSNTQYRVKLVSSRILEFGTGDMLDGEYNNHFPTGNGVPGGNTEFAVFHDRSATPTVRMSTSAGVINLRIFRGLKPATASQFLGHVNAGDYDNIFFTRKVNNFIIQGGSLKIDQNNMVVEPNAGPTVVNEFLTNGVISNLRGTVSLAKQGGDPDSASNQFFFNLGDNSANLDNQNGGFTVFAQTLNANSLAVLDFINGLDDVALHNDVTGNGVLPGYAATGVTHVPINDKSKYDGHGSDEVVGLGQNFDQNFVVYDNFNPSTDTVTVGRTSLIYLTRSLTAH